MDTPDFVNAYMLMRSPTTFFDDSEIDGETMELGIKEAIDLQADLQVRLDTVKIPLSLN